MEIISKSYVVPSEITPSDPIWLSNLDLTTMNSYTPTIYLYRRAAADSNNPADFFSADALKSSLGRILVQFYHLAGRIGPDQTGRPEIKCTADGVLFVVARSELTVDDLGEFEPSDELTRLFVPSADDSPPLVMFQVTYLKCGNVILGSMISHIASDGVAALHFINSWTDATRGIPLSTPPYLDRTVLRARSPLLVQFPHTQYGPFPAPSLSTPPAATACLRLSPRQVSLLKTTRHRSTFKAVATHAWRAACIARSLSPDQTTNLYFPADLRDRVKSIPLTYAGNAIYRMRATAKVGEIDTVEFATDGNWEEMVRSLVDYIETIEEVGKLQKGKWVLPQSDFVVTSWLQLPIYEVDFGWGKPEFVGRTLISRPGVFYLTKDSKTDGGVVVTVAMEPENMDEFKRVFYERLQAE